jgi:anti-anti-sigma factor
VTCNEGNNGKELTVAISGRFDFSHHKEFRETYRQYGEGVKYIVDLSRTEYMDSSALGMLLLLREHAGGDKKVSIVGCNDEIKEILKISNFQTLFDIK